MMPQELARMLRHIGDGLLSETVTPEHVALILQGVEQELQRDERLSELFVVRVVDHTAAPHAVVTAKLLPGALPLFRFDLTANRLRSCQDVREGFRIDLIMGDEIVCI